MIHVRNTADTEQFKISTRLLMQLALSKGYAVTYYPSSLSTPVGITRCEKQGKELFFKSTCTALTSSFGVFAAENKYLTKSLLDGAGVPMPATVIVGENDALDQATALLDAHKRVVVKPAAANHGDGVTVGVTDKAALENAVSFARAAGKNKDVLVQQQVEGREYRFLVVEGKVIAVANRRPPFVTGDGHSTVAELIEAKNSDPRRGKGHTKQLSQIELEDVKQHRGEAFLQVVVGDGQELDVLDTSNLSRGGEATNFTDQASPALKKMAEKAAASCFLGIAGVDIMTKDITADHTEDSYVLEVNLTPGIRMHQFPSQGQPIDVVSKIFAAIEKTAHPIGKPIKHLGRVEQIKMPALTAHKVYARIDTGASVSALWVSKAEETPEGLRFVPFGPSSPYYTGEAVLVKEYSRRVIASSMGHVEVRYAIKTPIVIAGRKIMASITLTDRSTQVYPVLVGRNVLRKKFIVDVSTGKAAVSLEKKRHAQLSDMLESGEGAV